MRQGLPHAGAGDTTLRLLVLLVAPVACYSPSAAADSGTLAPSRADSCLTADWHTRTGNNTAERRVVVIDSWPHTGMGHSTIGGANWMQLMSSLEAHEGGDRALRFAFCVPDSLDTEWAHKIRDAMPKCGEKHFDLYRHIGVDGLSNLQASPADFPADSKVLVKPSCGEMREAFRSEASKVLVYYPHVREVNTCLDEIHGKSRSKNRCMSHLTLVNSEHKLLPCDTGIQVRTLKLDDKMCDVWDEHSSATCPRGAHATSCPGGAAHGCEGALFATTDDPSVYDQLRPLGWKDYHEKAVVTWSPDKNTMDEATAKALDEDEKTVVAWMTLAQCKRIIAPVLSQYSISAAMVHDTPRDSCCKTQRYSYDSTRLANLMSLAAVNDADRSSLDHWVTGNMDDDYDVRKIL